MRRKILFCGILALVFACGRENQPPVQRAPESAAQDADTEEPVVLFLGTSLTAGYGLPPEQAYPAVVQSKIDSAGLDYQVVNAGVSGETSAGGLRRIDWLLQQPIAVLVLELGANDMLRGQDVEAMRANLQEIIDRTRAAHPNVRIVIAGMQAAPNLGEPYGRQFAATFVELADENGAELIPFLLDEVAGIPELNLPDGNHPNAEGQRLVADNVWRVLGPILQEID
jgi:acyl-CoA thioesterase-1